MQIVQRTVTAATTMLSYAAVSVDCWEAMILRIWRYKSKFFGKK